jgi:hypothetical protein
MFRTLHVRFVAGMFVLWMCLSFITLWATRTMACSFNTCNEVCNSFTSMGYFADYGTCFYFKGGVVYRPWPNPGPSLGGYVQGGGPVAYDLYDSCCVNCLGSRPISDFQSTVHFGNIVGSGATASGSCAGS